jgi:hypothetical protein
VSLKLGQTTKIFLMFAPLAAFFIGLSVLVGDMRHPDVMDDQCVVTGSGLSAQSHKPYSAYIYRQSGNELNDVSLRCNRMGRLMLNDAQLFLTPVKAGQSAHVARKRYRFIPDRWAVDVRTGVQQ